MMRHMSGSGISMTAARWLVLAMAGAAIAGCSKLGYSIPTPTYALVKDPAPYRIDSSGNRIDNAGVTLDQQGYRVDKKGQEMGIIDVQEKTAGQTSNPMAGFYISSIGTVAGGNVMAPSEGAGAGAGYGPGSVIPMPSGMEAPPPRTVPPRP
jgi:hypothetical protein